MPYNRIVVFYHKILLCNYCCCIVFAIDAISAIISGVASAFFSISGSMPSGDRNIILYLSIVDQRVVDMRI